MNRCELISSNYKQINKICRSLTNDWEDLSHDLCEYFLTCKADILEINERGKFLSYVYVAARNQGIKYIKPKRQVEIKPDKSADDEQEDFDEIPDITEETLQTEEIIKRLDSVDLKILTIFASGVSFTEVAEKTKINRHTLSKHLNEARENAKRIIKDL